ncbi:TetR/AcrR family transcriptional regulator [Streptomyces sp. CLI2509]|uniref:TetR/AcrR family transcriptional regulator n=2 Tax=unclassified Streptomyces TaxID=2593676 RepID=UPI000BACC017|nr:TetR/AcrR family transcriptional regulator [Streptomyces sp. CLI2509]ASY33992.1 TetR family transcriptional regulator [Streptomyces sp. CLI2509]
MRPGTAREASAAPPAPPLRADALRNRARLLAAAREVFAERGLDAPMATVARRAGVGVATLYRRFPTRDDLVRAAFAEQMDTCARVLDEAVADPDPWRGFQRLVETVCALQAEERGFPEAFVRAFPAAASAHTDAARAQAAEDFARLVARAQAAGALRTDFHPADFSMLLLAHGGLVAAAPADRASSRRLVAYLLESFRARPSRTALPSPGTLDLIAWPQPNTAAQPASPGA